MFRLALVRNLYSCGLKRGGRGVEKRDVHGLRYRCQLCAALLSVCVSCAYLLDECFMEKGCMIGQGAWGLHLEAGSLS